MYHWHFDEYPEPRSKGCPPEWIGLNRKLSVSANITDPTLYGGGELEFTLGSAILPTEKDRDQFRRQGTVILFPSHMMHRITPVTWGVRYSLVAWFLG
jgi:PKHD-type hydroxylase